MNRMDPAGDADGAVAELARELERAPHPGLRLSLLLTLYFRDGPTRRAAVAACFDAFRALAGSRLRWAFPSETGVVDLAERPEYAGPPCFLRDRRGAPEAWEFHWHAGTAADAASDLGLRAFGPGDGPYQAPGALSFLGARFPATWFAGREAEFIALARSWCVQLQPVHGYAGYGITGGADPFETFSGQGPLLQDLSARYKGLEIDAPAEHLIWLRRGIKGVNWLTVLSEEVVQGLPGEMEGLLRSVGEDRQVHRYENGALLQVGAEPQLLDGRDPTGEAAYARLAHLLRPIRVITHGALVNGVLGRDEMEAWLRRFDAQTQQPLGGRSSGGSHAR